MQHSSSPGARALSAGALALAFFASAGTASARPFRVDQIPNGHARSCQTCHETGGGIVFNAFGSDVRSNLSGEGPPQERGVNWQGLFARDSDGDGVTNGAELGDPDGTWKIGDPDPPGATSAPGDPNNAAASGGCGDGVLSAAETCDSDQLRGATCETENLGKGQMLCGLDCHLDTTGCDGSTPEEDDDAAAAPTSDGCAMASRDGSPSAAGAVLSLLAASAFMARRRRGQRRFSSSRT